MNKFLVGLITELISRLVQWTGKFFKKKKGQLKDKKVATETKGLTAEIYRLEDLYKASTDQVERRNIIERIVALEDLLREIADNNRPFGPS